MRLKKIVKRVICIVVVLAIITVVGLTYFVSPTAYTISTTQFSSSALPSGFDQFSIAFFSDCNLNDEADLERFEKAVEKLNTYDFDMALFGGDLFENSPFKNEQVSAILKNIDCKYGKFAVLGDKDSSSIEIESILNEGGFEVITNKRRSIYYNDEKISLVGLDNETIASEKFKDDDLFHLTLTHMPDTFDYNYGSTHLQLSGHSNGGYFYLPLLGSLITEEGCENYNHGTYKKEESTLIVTNGFKGTSKLPYKFLCTNEIKIITFNYIQDI